MNNKPTFHYEIAFPDFKPSDAVRTDIENHLAKLEHFFDRIISCHVAVRIPNMHTKKHLYQIRIHLEIPGDDIIVDHDPGLNMNHSDIHVAIRDAFKALNKSLRKKVDEMRKKNCTY